MLQKQQIELISNIWFIQWILMLFTQINKNLPLNEVFDFNFYNDINIEFTGCCLIGLTVTGLYKNYWDKDQKYSLSHFKWQHKKGLYSSQVHMNYVDKKNTKFAQLMRQNGIDDLNMFVTNFILYGLLQAEQLGALSINSHKFSQSLMAISNFHDKNTPNGIPVYNFWVQSKINGTWVATPRNLLNLVQLMPDFSPTQASILDKIGLGIIASAKSLSTAFVIPPDNDDSSVNLALQSLMKQNNSPHYEFFASLHSRKQQYYEKALKYAYRPFKADKIKNIHGDEIDPRTYYVLHKFIQQKRKQSLNPQLILPTTWLITIDQQIPNRVVMPFNCNNVDVSVATNFLLGLISQIIIEGYQTSPQLQTMMINTAQLIQYAIQEMIQKRPSLLLVYYPSKYDFYWFVARVVNLLKRYDNLEANLQRIKQILVRTMKVTGTKQILNAAKTKNNQTFWFEFLGNYGQKQRHQDAFFSTSLAMNALIDIWTTGKKQLKFDEDTPLEVKLILKKGVQFLLNNMNKQSQELNAFFSGSVKTFSTLPFFYPSNVNYSPSNPSIDPNTASMSQISDQTVSFMKGTINDQQYQQMLNKKWYQISVPQKQESFNSGYGLLFPFWSAQPFTQIMGINALAKIRKIQENNSQLFNLRSQA